MALCRVTFREQNCLLLDKLRKQAAQEMDCYLPSTGKDLYYRIGKCAGVSIPSTVFHASSLLKACFPLNHMYFTMGSYT